VSKSHANESLSDLSNIYISSGTSVPWEFSFVLSAPISDLNRGTFPSFGMSSNQYYQQGQQ
jgi:hypothetical protein